MLAEASIAEPRGGDAARSPTPPPERAGGHGRLVLKVAGIVVVLQLVYVFCFVYPGRDPRPNGLRVGVVATSGQVSTVRKQLAATLPGVELVRLGSADQARAAVEQRDVYGAFVFSGGTERLISASAASFTVSTLLAQAAAAAGVDTRDVVPLSSGDPRGAVLNLLIVPLIVTALIGAQLAVSIVGGVALRRRLWTIAVVAAVAAAAVMTLVGLVLEALPGPILAEGAVLALAVFGLLTVGGGLVRLLGASGLGIGFAVFLMLGSPASGAASAPELLPTPWAQAGEWLTPGALANGLRSLAYFDGAHIAKPLVALCLIAALGVGLEVLAQRRTPTSTAVV